MLSHRAATEADSPAILSLAECWHHQEETEEDLLQLMRGPGYRPDFALLAIAPAGDLARVCTGTADSSVDGENPTGAVRLYESVGFVTNETWLSYYRGDHAVSSSETQFGARLNQPRAKGA